MKLSRLVKQLKILLEKEGDIDVLLPDLEESITSDDKQSANLKEPFLNLHKTDLKSVNPYCSMGKIVTAPLFPDKGIRQENNLLMDNDLEKFLEEKHKKLKELGL